MGSRGRDYGDVRRQCSDFANGDDCTQRCVRELEKPTGYSLAYLSRLSITEPHKIKHWKKSSAMVSTTDRFASEKINKMCIALVLWHLVLGMLRERLGMQLTVQCLPSMLSALGSIPSVACVHTVYTHNKILKKSFKSSSKTIFLKE